MICKMISHFGFLIYIILNFSLIEAGAHMDAVNSYGETPFETATTGCFFVNRILDWSVAL